MIFRVGIELPTIEVRFEHLNIEAEAYVGSRGLPTVINFTFNMLEVTLLINMHLGVCDLIFFIFESFNLVIPLSFSKGLLSTLHILPSQKKTISILHDVSGIIKPRR